MSRPARGALRSRTLLENVVLAVSLVAVAAVVIGLVVAAVGGGDDGPDLRATVRATGLQRSGGAIYEVEIRNVGGHTAENVVIEVTLGDEKRELEVLSVAKGDDETATVVFPPGASGTAAVRVLSYHETTRG